MTNLNTNLYCSCTISTMASFPGQFDNVFKYNRENQIDHQTRQSNMIHISRSDSNFSKTNSTFLEHGINGTEQLIQMLLALDARGN